MKGSVYVVGGKVGEANLSCCERYDIKQGKWFPSTYSLPCYLLSNSPAVSVSMDESFAIITDGTDDSIIIFTEETGFFILDESSTSNYRAMSKQMETFYLTESRLSIVLE